MRIASWTTALLLVLCGAATAIAGDWPMWRYDAGRTAASPHGLARTLHLQWVRELPPPRPAWPATQTKLQFDRSYEPVVMGRRMFVGSNVDDSIRAFDTRDGKELWRSYADGPVRFAPVALDGRVYAASDDGHLYCLDAADGSLLWKVNGGPGLRPIMGNRRLISSWPARGGPVAADGVVYFAASIWPSMGIFVRAVDAKTGRVLWTNSEAGSLYVVHPHGAPAFGSVVPQGHLALNGDDLIVPGGRSTPAVFDRRTGRLKFFRFDKRNGGHRVMTRGPFYFVGGSRYALKDGVSAGAAGPAVLTEDAMLSAGRGRIAAAELNAPSAPRLKRDRRGRLGLSIAFVSKPRWTLTPTDGSPAEVRLVAGGRLFTAEKNRVASFAMPRVKPGDKLPLAVKAKADWTATVEGNVSTLLAADGRLFAVTVEGSIYCFGPQPQKRVRHEWKRSDRSPGGRLAGLLAEGLIRAASLPRRNDAARRGPHDPPCCIVYGLPAGGDFAAALAKQAELNLIVVEADREKVDRFRRTMSDAGRYGRNLSAVAGDGVDFPLPPYLAEYSICLDPNAAGLDFTAASLKKLYRPLRPYGGSAWLRLSEEEHARFRQAVAAAKLAKADVRRVGRFTLLRRTGALPGAGKWTHQYGDAANSVVSQDALVKAPLGVLWFGGPSHEKVLPRHGHGPNPQVAGGRIVIEGPDMLRALDVYTGRLLWERELPGLGSFYDVTRHFSGAGEVGSNYVTLAEAVYVVYGNRLLELDPQTGRTRREFPHPGEKAGKDAAGRRPFWGHIAVSGDVLLATSAPVKVAGKGKRGAAPFQPAQFSSASRRLVVFDRQSGKLLWQRAARFSFRHNAVALGNGTVFCIDGLSPVKVQLLKRRGIDASGKARLLALDAKSGREIWSANDDVFGTFLNYSARHDVLLQAGSAYRDRARDEVSRGMVAYRGRDGKVLWKDLELKYGGPCLLWRDKIITNGSGGFQLELLTGKKTGWTYSRMYGCNTAVGCRNLLTFRSGAAGFCDLTGDSGTGNIGGFRSSCTSNLIAGDGVLAAPDYTRTCSCAYQNQTSLGLVFMPENEFWTFNRRPLPGPSGESARIGLNLGAPGDRRSATGTLWIDVPSVGGPSPDLAVTVEPARVEWFHRHSSAVHSGALKWVAASGGEGLRRVQVSLGPAKGPARRYTVRLVFAEPRDVKPGERVFSISLQGHKAAEQVDIARSAGGTMRTLVRQFRDVAVRDTLKIELSPARESKRPPVLCGVELIRTR